MEQSLATKLPRYLKRVILANFVSSMTKSAFASIHIVSVLNELMRRPVCRARLFYSVKSSCKTGAVSLKIAMSSAY